MLERRRGLLTLHFLLISMVERCQIRHTLEDSSEALVELVRGIGAKCQMGARSRGRGLTSLCLNDEA